MRWLKFKKYFSWSAFLFSLLVLCVGFFIHLPFMVSATPLVIALIMLILGEQARYKTLLYFENYSTIRLVLFFLVYFSIVFAGGALFGETVFFALQSVVLWAFILRKKIYAHNQIMVRHGQLGYLKWGKDGVHVKIYKPETSEVYDLLDYYLLQNKENKSSKKLMPVSYNSSSYTLMEVKGFYLLFRDVGYSLAGRSFFEFILLPVSKMSAPIKVAEHSLSIIDSSAKLTRKFIPPKKFRV